MKKCYLILLCVLLLFTGCEDARYERKMAEKAEKAELAESAYQDGYNDGYSDGLFVAGEDEGVPYDGELIVWTETPNSSCFSYVGFDSKNQKLAVVFRENPDRTYVYSDFSMLDYRDFMAADSLGSYYNKNIKGVYPSERIDDIEGTEYDPEG